MTDPRVVIHVFEAAAADVLFKMKCFIHLRTRLPFFLCLSLFSSSAWSQLPDTPPEYSLFDFIQQSLESTPPRFAVPEDPAAVPAWRSAAAEKLRGLLKVDGSRPVPLEARTIRRVQRDGYIEERVVFRSEAFVEVPAVLLIPDGVTVDSPAPAVLCLSGAVGAGKEEVIGNLDFPGAKTGHDLYADDYGLQLARQGLITLSIDLRNYGERRYFRKNDPYNLSHGPRAMESAGVHLLFIGRTYFGVNVFDSLRALDYLVTRPEVDPDAIGCVGFSFGSNLTAWVTALDRRVKAAAIVGSWASWRRLSMLDLSRFHGDAEGHLLTGLSFQTIPDFFLEMDLNISIALAAPTPLSVGFEYDNWLFSTSAELSKLQMAERDATPITRAYAGFDALDDLHLKFDAGGHRWRPEILPWFVGKLNRTHD